MISRIPSASLASCPSYPNSILWSEENLLAVAAGKRVIILNPTLPSGPRGFIMLPPDRPFRIGIVTKKDLMSACLLPNCLRDGSSPCVRSISWSPLGLAPNSGCLLAVCTVEGRVKIYMSESDELRSEWTEVVDISDMLSEYFVKADFLDATTLNKAQANESNKKHGHRELDFHGNQTDTLPIITAKEYTSRYAMISNLVVAWSPLFHLSFDNELHKKCSVLALGGKGGQISFWRFQECQSFSSKQNEVYAEPVFIGLVHAHSAWITALTFDICRADASRPQLLLVSGSSDGSVKVWIGHIEQLVSSKFTGSSFVFLRELTPTTYAPVSSLSLVALKFQPCDFVLAIGRGSGMLEALVWHLPTSSFRILGTFHAHEKVITGLRWAFDGQILYSCSQDCRLRCWTLHGNSLQELPFPSNVHGKGTSNVTQISDPCFGLALSPGSFIMSVVHGLDSNLLNPMYEARTQKAAVEFFWMGGRPLDTSLSKPPTHNALSGYTLPESNLQYWESDLLWSVRQFENVDMELVMWDVVTALVEFKQSVPERLESILCLLLSSWCMESIDGHTKSILSHILNSVSLIETRKLHILNIISRRVFMSKALESIQNGQWHGNCRDGTKSVSCILWENLLTVCERELLGRVMAFSFKAFLHVASHPFNGNCWFPSGVAQMQQWVASDPTSVSDEIKILALNIKRLGSRLDSVCEYAPEERCVYCSALVPFQHPDIAFCSNIVSTRHPQDGHTLLRCSTFSGGGEPNGGIHQGHKLFRCSASMRICQLSPLWFCKCCQRWADDLVPEIFFKSCMPPSDVRFEILPSYLTKPSKPLCPYCGVLMQRSKPQFMLSASPV